MNITKEYFPDKGVVVVTVENPPLGTTKHTIYADALANGKVDLQREIKRLEAEAERRLAVHEAVLRAVK